MDTDFFARLSRRTRQSNLEESIQNSLRWMLNSRKGFVPHLPDYGIRDLADMRNKKPREELRREIREAVLKYEPRIKEIEVEEIEVKEESLKSFYVVYKLHIVLQEHLGGTLTLIYGFDYDGKASSVE